MPNFNSYSDEVDADNPYIWWKLDQTSGSEATDSSGNGRHGTYVGSPTLNSTSLINEGKSVDFNGSSQYVKWLPSADWSGSFSIECWFRADTNTYDTLFGAWVANSNNNYGTNFALNTANSFDLNITRDNYDFWLVNTAIGSVSTGTTYHIVITCDNAANEAKVYKNGVQEGTTQNFGSTFNGGIWGNGNEIRVAAAGEIDGGSFDGRIQHFAVYDTVLTSTRIGVHYDQGRNKDIDASPRSNTSVGGNTNTTITTTNNKTVTQDKTNIGVGGNTNTSVTIAAGGTADVTNIAIAAPSPTLFVEFNNTQNVTKSNINISAPNVTLIVDTSIFIGANTTNIDIESFLPEVQISDSVTVTTSNITVNGQEVLELYPTLVLEHDPIHYYRFIDENLITDIVDYGSGQINGIATNAILGNFDTGITGDPISESLLFTSSTSNLNTNNIIRFGNNRIFNDADNLTYEFWIKTSSPNVPVLCVDETDITLIGIIWGGQTTRQTAYIGVYDGYLAFWRLGVTNQTFITKTTNYIADNSWHHIVLTKQTTNSTATYKSYVDAEETSIVISLGGFLQYGDGANRHSLMNSIKDDNQTNILYNYTAYLDEVAIYNILLDEDEISDHHVSGTGFFNAEIQPVVTDIEVTSSTSARSTAVNVIKSNTTIRSHGSIVKAGGTVKVVTTTANTTLDETDVTSSAVASLTITQQVSNINITTTSFTKVRVRNVLFKFVAGTDTSLSAEDAESITDLDFAGMLYNQIKKKIFRIGNLDTYPSTFILSAISADEKVLSAISLSTDNITYSDTITIGNVPPNTITDPLYIKFDVNEIDILGPGTFLVSVEQINE